MSRDTSEQQYARMFDLPAKHTLKQCRGQKTERNNTVYETRWLEEFDDNDALVTRFRTWTNRSLKPPYRQQMGWERFSLDGKLMDREVRYSKRNSMAYLH